MNAEIVSALALKFALSENEWVALITGIFALAVAVATGALGIIAIWIRGRRLERSSARVEAQFSNNGGSSAKDQMDRVEWRLFHISKHLVAQDERMQVIDARLNVLDKHATVSVVVPPAEPPKES